MNCFKKLESYNVNWVMYFAFYIHKASKIKAEFGLLSIKVPIDIYFNLKTGLGWIRSPNLCSMLRHL